MNAQKKKIIVFSVPQGSVQGAFPFITYTSIIQDVIKEDLILNGFADDHSLTRSFNPNQTNSGNMSDEDSTIAIIEDSMQNIKSWMDAVRLKLNESKTHIFWKTSITGKMSTLINKHHR